MDGWMNGWIDRYMNGWMDRQMNGWMDGWIDEWMDRGTNGWMNGWMVSLTITYQQLIETHKGSQSQITMILSQK